MVAASEIAKLVEQSRRSNYPVSLRSGDLSQTQIDQVATTLKSGGLNARYRVGGYYGGEGSYDTLLLTEDQQVAGPILWEDFAIVEEIGVDVTTAGTEGNLYVAVYNDAGGYPGALVHVSAALAVTVGFKSTTGLSIAMAPGLYWASVVCNQVTTTVATVRSLVNNSRFVGETSGANDINKAAYAITGITGAPSGNFGATVAVVAEAPNVLFKIKSK